MADVTIRHIASRDGAMSDVVLVGPFWTRDEAASYLGQSPDELCRRGDVLRLAGHWLEETYPAFQFRDHEVRFEVAAIVSEVGDELSGTAIADWLFRPNPLLGAMTPLDWFNTGSSLDTALVAIHNDLEDARGRSQPSDRRIRAS